MAAKPLEAETLKVCGLCVRSEAAVKRVILGYSVIVKPV